MQQPADSAKKVPNQFFWHLSKIVRNAPIHITTWMYDNKKTYPGFIFRAGFVAVGIVMATISMYMVSTAYAVITEDVVMQAATAIGLIGFFILLSFMARGTYLAGMHTWQEWNENPPIEAQKLITASTWQPPSLGVDTLICLLPGETLASFHEREKAAKAATSYAIWAAIIPPFQNAAAIYTAEEETDFIFTRGDEPFLNPDAPDYVDRRAWDHSDETYQAYTQYVDFFAPRFVKFAEQKKLVVKQERASRTFFEINAAKALTATVVLSFLLFCLPVFGQSKTQQVDAALMQVSGQIDPIPPAGAAVTYEFQTGTKTVYIDRKADGKSTYMELLPKSTGIVRYNDAGGELSLIKVNGEPVIQRNKPKLVNVPSKSVEPQPQRIQSPVAPNGAVYLPPNNTGDPIRPRGTLEAPDVANTPVMDEPMRISIPDSLTTSAYLEDAKQTIRKQRGELWQMIKPGWEFVMWCFGGVVILLICFGGLCQYVADTAASESLISVYGRVIVGGWIVSVQQNAAAMTLLVCWVIAIVLLINEFLWLVYLDIPIWALLIVWLPSLWAAKKLTKMYVPNLKVVSSNGKEVQPTY